MTSIANSSRPMSLCETCRDRIAEIGTVLLHPQPLSALPAAFNGEFLVIVACDKQHWWDIAWRMVPTASLTARGAMPPGSPTPSRSPGARCRLLISVQSAVAIPLSSSRNPAAQSPRRAAACLGRKR